MNQHTAVEPEKDAQGIDVHREVDKKRAHLVGDELFFRFSRFLSFFGASRICADFCASTADSRLSGLLAVI